ncbi:AAA domain-containing protein [Triangularia verruculosa]|uniref:AAA domain-containing protein n=1 Tax=Triangularia verruculosa TaxID=2587418 RepID=A0AAN6X8K4_9PEZI|nr:AAA domain-containing protein [Triangularia verruculosa]
MPRPPNIYIVGAQCTGKTTLVNNLRNYFDSASSQEPPLLITEVARTVLKKHSFTAADVVDPDRSMQLQSLILQAQASVEREAANSSQWFISDRSGADPIAYALRYVDQGRAQQLINSPEWKDLRSGMQGAAVVVCEASREAESWLMDDGVRLMPEDVDDWIAMHKMFCKFFKEQGIKYDVLSAGVGDHQERVDYVLQSWQRLKAWNESN